MCENNYMSEWDKKSGVDQEKAEKMQQGFRKAGNTDIVGNMKSAWLNMKSAFSGDKDKKLTDEQKEQR